MEPDDPFAVPVPQGELLGEVPGVFGVLGLAVDGCVVLPGVELFGDVDPGVVVFGVPLGEAETGVCPGVVCGVAVLAGGVAVLAGGVAVPAGGVAGEPGVEVCPELLLEPPAGAPPPAELWATAQLPQHNTTASNISFRDNIFCLQAFRIVPASYWRRSRWRSASGAKSLSLTKAQYAHP